MSQSQHANRRHVIAGFGALGIAAASSSHANAVDAADFGLVTDSDEDQTAHLSAACTAARDSGRSLLIPAGQFRIQNLELFGNIVIEGLPGRSILLAIDSQPAAIAADFTNVVLRHLEFRGQPGNTSGEASPLLVLRNASDITIEHCTFSYAAVGIGIEQSSATIAESTFSYLADAGIHSMNSKGLLIRDNRIDTCGNAGIRIWRSENGSDGSIITGNRISNIEWRGGGNGQNGNGVNVFKADEVIVSDNHISDCAFTAVRLNSTNNSQVSGNICLRSGEVAIFSEFAFSGSIIANNIIDGAATGISVTNFDTGGQLAVVSGNIVRNITPTSLVNPDTVPIGIFAEAETAITGNTVQNVPGIAIAAGYGTYLRNVVISANVVSASNVGIGVSVVDGAGAAHIADNLIHEPRDYAVVGLAWLDVAEPDLLTNAGKYPNITAN